MRDTVCVMTENLFQRIPKTQEYTGTENSIPDTARNYIQKNKSVSIRHLNMCQTVLSKA